MTAQHLPQTDLDAAECDVANTGKPKELTVSNVRRLGILLLRLRPSKQGVVGSWTVRFQEGAARPTIPWGDYCKKGVNGHSLERAMAEFDEWVSKKRGGLLLVKPKGNVAHEPRTREQLAPVPKSQTVRALIDIYLNEYAAKQNTATTARTNRYMFDAHLNKQGLADRRAKDIVAKDIQDVVNEITAEGSPALADRFRATMRSIYNMAAKATAGTAPAEVPKGYADFGIVSPDLKLVSRVKGAKKARRKPMAGELLTLVYEQLAVRTIDLGGRPTVPLLRATLRLSLLLGGTRFEQVNRLQPDDFCFASRQVTLIDEKGRWDKEAREYQLPLTETAVQVAKVLLAERDKGYVLSPGVFGAAMKRAMRRAGINDEGKKQGRDVRSTIATWWNLREQSVRREVQNYVQSHGHMIEDEHYIEGSAMEQEIREALEKLENLLLGRVELKEAA